MLNVIKVCTFHNKYWLYHLYTLAAARDYRYLDYFDPKRYTLKQQLKVASGIRVFTKSYIPSTTKKTQINPVLVGCLGHQGNKVIYSEKATKFFEITTFL